ncbi:MAG: AMP-binding protein [Roseinatronobacter sp.]
MARALDIAARRAELSPHALAFADLGTGRDWSFAEINTEAAALARALRAKGLAPGDRVAILSLNRAEVFIALFAARKAGLIMAPLNWRLPLAERAPIAQMVGTRAVIHDALHAGAAAELGLPCIAMSATGGFGLDGPDFAQDAEMTEDDPWYLLFTSGTTGLPKAVIQTHRMALANAMNIAQATSMTATDRTACFLPLFHTAGINLYTLPLFLWGGATVILPKFEPDDLLRLIDAGEITKFFGVPAIYQAFLAHPDLTRTNLSRVTHWGCGGAALPEAMIRALAAHGARVCAGYGMTETGPTGFLLDPDQAEAQIGSVGLPRLMTEARLDGVPDGAAGTGELLLRGATVTPGYFGNPQATADSFTPEGWLRSGDVATRDEAGFYRIVDRIKDMYISGGENVYPAEVERALLAHPDVLEAAVIGVPDPRWGETGAAFVLPRPGSSPTAETLRDWLRPRLAGYKLPAHWRLVADMPRTAAGKIRKPDLRKMFE